MAQMTDTQNERESFGWRVFAPAGLLMLLTLAIPSICVNAQAPGAPSTSPGQFIQPPQADGQSTPASPPSPQRSPGFLESIGRWMDESAANMNKSLDDMWQGAARNSSEAAKASNEATSNLARGTADALGKLGAGRIATGRARCAIAANGAPDCRLAAEQLCKSKGFSTGNSLENETVERCSPLVLLRGNKKPGECPIEHTVTRAMCQ
jgi:hypothetical protein